jgi:hypothetical protein
MMLSTHTKPLQVKCSLQISRHKWQRYFPNDEADRRTSKNKWHHGEDVFNAFLTSQASNSFNNQCHYQCWTKTRGRPGQATNMAPLQADILQKSVHHFFCQGGKKLISYSHLLFDSNVRIRVWKRELNGTILLISSNILSPLIDWRPGQQPGWTAPQSGAGHYIMASNWAHTATILAAVTRLLELTHWAHIVNILEAATGLLQLTKWAHTVIILTAVTRTLRVQKWSTHSHYLRNSNSTLRANNLRTQSLS